MNWKNSNNVAIIAIIVMIALGLGIRAVSAHSALIDGTPTCTAEGWSVAWTATNDDPHSIVSPASLVMGGNTTKSLGAQTYPFSQATATFTVSGAIVWSDNFTQNGASKTVNRPANCPPATYTPTATATKTATPTATSTSTSTPTATSTSTPTATSTLTPVVNTSTPTPTSTATPIPPTATSTVPPTSTFTQVPPLVVPPITETQRCVNGFQVTWRNGIFVNSVPDFGCAPKTIITREIVPVPVVSSSSSTRVETIVKEVEKQVFVSVIQAPRTGDAGLLSP